MLLVCISDLLKLLTVIFLKQVMESPSSDKRLGLAICKGLNKGSPTVAWRQLCSRAVMCPRCEARKATRRAAGIMKRLEALDSETEGDFICGVLTVTLPGKGHPIRHGSLREQYEYMTERVSLPGLKGGGLWSMRGLNKLLVAQTGGHHADCTPPVDYPFARKSSSCHKECQAGRYCGGLGAMGGIHFLEFTHKGKWWNLHSHTLFWARAPLDRIKSTGYIDFEDDLFGVKRNPGRTCIAFKKLGFGPRYTLDYADDQEMEILIRYSSKIAYLTKPFKAPARFRDEIQDFMSAVDGGKQPRLARPFGDATKSIESIAFKDHMLKQFPWKHLPTVFEEE